MEKIKIILVILLSLVVFEGSTGQVFADTYGQENTCSGTYGQETECGKVLGTETEVIYLADTALDTPSTIAAIGLFSIGIGAWFLKKKIA